MSIYNRIVAVGCLCMFISSARSQVRDSAYVRDSLIREDVKANIPIIAIDETDSDNGNAAGQNISSILYAGRDPYFSNVANFNAARFKVRGYNADYFETYINGIPVKNITNGFTPWSLWGGLNDVMRNRQSANGLRPVDFGLGEIGGVNNIDTRAFRQRQQLSISYAATRGNYNHRLMASWSSGMSKKGWAFSLAASGRYSKDGYVEGTFYEGASYFFAVDKKINAKHMLSFVTFGSPTADGGQSAATKEMYDLAGSHYYNSSWGWQDGKKRSANYTTTYQPYAIVSHEWKIDDKSRLNTAVAFSYGERARTGLDWYNAPDPRPDYYRNLPSYQESTAAAEYIANKYRTDESYRQINWTKMYNINRINEETVENANGITGNSVTGNRSLYILQDRVVQTTKFNFNTIYNKNLNKHADLTAGIYFNHQRDRNYQRVHDLLGGDFYVNVNKFAQQTNTSTEDVEQFDLDNPNRILKRKDKYGYDYSMNVNDAKVFLQGMFHYDHVDFFVSGAYDYTSMFREGYIRNGLYPTNSKGKSETFNFNNYAFKAGATYKIDGRNYVFLNASASTRSPYVENIFTSPRNHNGTQSDVKAEKIYSAEAGYVMNAEKVKVRLNAYYSLFQDGMDIMSYYDDSYASFVNYALSNIDKVNYGMEFGIEVPVYEGLKATAAANIGRYFYDSRQHAVVTSDNSSDVITSETVYTKNYHVGQTPQEAYTVGLNYQGKKNWFINVNANYFDKMWLEINPVRRTERATEDVQHNSTQWHSILDQEQLPAQLTMDLFGGKTWYTHVGGRSASIVFTLGVNNLLNNRNLISGGYEQLRFNYTDKDASTFPPKFYYAYGANFFASLAFRL
ncbi:TonB-dependent receptor [[Flexibacter] sp. ATCC 35208]|uniref:TonB-dependent receptor n=1 Tax=[Flexibacter] sp. ATCC 35208 TaxID=1936242 RepID=UPI0009C5D550|nr:TonB-dependent receptor [[Flexibacter] sp. ATCC 35208]OMP78998.1 hypothetical protein BW716_11590 [[Flexibacter] sp. ATCC 35208]